jgi:hypothetical protein
MVISEFAKYWKCLYPKENAQQRIESMSGIRLDDILRANQYYEWEKKFDMGPLQLWGIGDTSPSFKNYALASKNFRDDVPLVVIVHDAPETTMLPDRDSSGVSAHNTVVVSLSIILVLIANLARRTARLTMLLGRIRTGLPSSTL